MKRTIGSTALSVGARIAPLGSPAEAAHADTTAPRIDLRVLVVSDGGPATGAIASEPGATADVPEQDTTSRAPRTRVPAGVTEQVPCAPHN
ncbi:hypothetical protein BKI49_00265 [Streptomyces sp. Tue6028]|uniref:hypothetical protein n=1 Tax=Streptomyces sp. Tue6028 TaxID=2036037 RepID=UPI000BB3C5C3|nr:hypothetical protein [Streptomyces sp. Tue6028]PBC65739.1 hypothetical protein BKI49_00265 [Streptomyces sp. Tue6028]